MSKQRITFIRFFLFLVLVSAFSVWAVQSEKTKVSIYGTDYCKFCRMAKSLLKERQIEFVFHDLSNPTEEMIRCAYKSLPKGSVKTIPQVYIGDYYVGGYRELESLCKSGQIYTLI